MKYEAIAACGIIMILVIILLVSSRSVFAGSYEKGQVISQTNECGSYWFPLDVLCSNLGSQIQGEKNIIAIAAPDQEQDENSQVTHIFTPFP
ncbi:MAG: hypothetical protein WBX01_14620 [Nitrososphaeraceae archaeon]|jgi:hypothetical protein